MVYWRRVVHSCDMADKDVVLAVLSNDIAVAALLLVFAGFVITKAESFQNEIRADRFRWLARFSLVPIVAALGSAWLSIDAIQGCGWCSENSLLSLKAVLALTGIYAIIAALVTF
jgi:aminoglycoside phosphotransferase